MHSPLIIGIIPARMASSRFPGKVLADRTGKPLIQHVYEAAARASTLSRLVVATDDQRVADAVARFDADCVLTSPDHPNGTSRLAEAAAILQLPDDAIVVNVQGDEPELEPTLVDSAVNVLVRTGLDVGTAAIPIPADEDPDNPNLVKVTVGANEQALYFSRSRIPYPRNPGPHARPLRHIGIYTYRRRFLRTYGSLAPTPLELAESLEQLRVLEHGYAIAVAVCQGAAHAGIDTPEQYDAFVTRWQATH
jgi:3-deoxy-manno-octulosonate cytidylyltransferase (CMP-KDO synthetase)